jgi:hypothetical protein
MSGRLIPARPVLAQAGGDPVLVGAGDIVNCNDESAYSTAELVESIPGTVFTLGDNAYNQGTTQQFNDCYDPTWGRFKDRTAPVVGNHEYKTAGAEGYYTYFGIDASPLDLLCTKDCKGYYSYNLGSWHIIVLNSNIEMAAGSEQEQWLRFDLAANPAACTLAMFHEPRFTSGRHGNSGRVRPLWDVLYEYGADVVLNGHDHNYQRYAPQDPRGRADPKGIREFIVGTGGGELYELGEIIPNVDVRDNTSRGVLKLTLHQSSYDWEFIPIPGDTFRDFGASTCVTDKLTAQLIPTATPLPSPTPTLAPTNTPLPSLQVAATLAPVSEPQHMPSIMERVILWLRQVFGG